MFRKNDFFRINPKTKSCTKCSLLQLLPKLLIFHFYYVFLLLKVESIDYCNHIWPHGFDSIRGNFLSSSTIINNPEQAVKMDFWFIFKI